MNCPQCLQLVGNDQVAMGEWKEQRNERGAVIDVQRELVVACDHCGVFHVEQSADLHVRRVFQPSGERARQNLRRHLPNPNHVEAA